MSSIVQFLLVQDLAILGFPSVRACRSDSHGTTHLVGVDLKVLLLIFLLESVFKKKLPALLLLLTILSIPTLRIALGL